MMIMSCNFYNCTEQFCKKRQISLVHYAVTPVSSACNINGIRSPAWSICYLYAVLEVWVDWMFMDSVFLSHLLVILQPLNYKNTTVQKHKWKKCTQCGQLILRIISKIGTTTRPDVRFKAKMHQIRFPLGLHPRPRWGSVQHPQIP